jgi:hypothetical protein
MKAMIPSWVIFFFSILTGFIIVLAFINIFRDTGKTPEKELETVFYLLLPYSSLLSGRKSRR